MLLCPATGWSAGERWRGLQAVVPDLLQYATAGMHTGQLLKLPDLSSIYGCQMPDLNSLVRAAM